MNTGVEPLTISPTRTYVVVIHDVVCPNEARFEKVLLPESFENNSKNAKYYYHSINQDRATLILACIAIEDYIKHVNDLIKEVVFEPSVQKKGFFNTRSTSLTEDMKEVRQMLDAWNNEQKFPSTTYTQIMRSVLCQLELQDKILAEMKGALNFVKAISPKKGDHE